MGLVHTAACILCDLQLLVHDLIATCSTFESAGYFYAIRVGVSMHMVCTSYHHMLIISVSYIIHELMERGLGVKLDGRSLALCTN